MDKYADLQKELVRALTERLLDIEYDLAKRNCFLFDVEIDHHIFDLLSDHLWHKTAFAETISELMKSVADSDVFDRRVRECAYDDLYKALGGIA
ncbi:hypothetical protein [Limnohabitans sp. 63ED37-2]|uniref:hypothetical protein n=1 Tax=Limnohabitans sp. 63ED37-2 TaxID=1678128 RepID=UPI0007056850|nr:hypothetical protein [Limnohabitans sp. 63ED37-2]ALK87614.1 hypothetical protein L63ED372_00385 [Limnohabitans sp. 63ED37-2]